MTMNLSPINAAIDAAFATALANGGQRVTPATIAPNVTLQTDTYVGPAGSGFRVVCKIRVPAANFTATRVRNHGPDTTSEREWPAEGIEVAARAHVARCIQAGLEFVQKKGFDAIKLLKLSTELQKAKEAAALAGTPPEDIPAAIAAARPKMAALYAWTEAVSAMAIAGQTMFPQPPHTFEEVIAE